MRRSIIATTISAFAMLTLGACAESEEEAREDLVEQQYESQEDVIEEQADLAEAQGNQAREEELDAQADAMGEAGDQAEDMIIAE